MYTLQLICVLCLFYLAAAKDSKDDKPSDVVIHATNFTSVPSVHYLIDAVECLKQAYTVYTEPVARAQLYAELFQEKHNETEWNVVAGYSVAYIKSQWYVETSVSNGQWQKDDKEKDKNKDKETLYLIFSGTQYPLYHSVNRN